jgi:isopentenyl phosphate kinase
MVWALAALYACSAVNCTKQQAVVGEKLAVKVADELCKELADPTEPEWVAVLCNVEGVVGGAVKVLLPRKEWGAIRSRRADAGPGK